MKYLLITILIILIPLSFAHALSLKDAAGMVKTTANSAGYQTDKPGSDVFNTTIGVIVRTTLSLLGVVFLGLMVYGGFLWMTDRGNEQQVKKSQHLISAAVIGLIIILSAYAISYFVLSKLQAATLNFTS